MIFHLHEILRVRNKRILHINKYINILSSSSYIFHGVGPLVDLFCSHVSRSLFKVYHVSFCQLGSSISLPWIIHFKAFYLHVVSSFSCIPVICPKLVLFFNSFPICAYLCNLPKCILFFSCFSFLLLLFFWCHLL